MEKKDVLCNLIKLLVIVTLSFCASSCDNLKKQTIETEGPRISLMKDGFDFSYDPFLHFSQPAIQSQVFSNLLLDNKYTYKLPSTIKPEQLESLFFEGSRSSLVRPLVSLFPRKRIGRLCVVD